VQRQHEAHGFDVVNLVPLYLDYVRGCQIERVETPRRSYEVDLHGAVGEAHIRLPRSVGIIATATTGVGELNVNGLEKKGNTWINPGHENDAVVIRLTARGDVGEMNISAD